MLFNFKAFETFPVIFPLLISGLTSLWLVSAWLQLFEICWDLSHGLSYGLAELMFVGEKKRIYILLLVECCKNPNQIQLNADIVKFVCVLAVCFRIPITCWQRAVLVPTVTLFVYFCYFWWVFLCTFESLLFDA
jgi:hypothetical protein